MIKRPLQIATFLLGISLSCASFANTAVNTSIDNSNVCAMKNLAVNCEKGDKIKLDVIRNHDQRGVVFLNIDAKDAIGDHLLLYINNNKPEILKIENGNTLSKGVFISYALISKLKAATSVHFQISMQKRSPIIGDLGQYHFDWLKRFGNACS